MPQGREPKVKQKQHCNKFNTDFYQKKKKKKKSYEASFLITALWDYKYTIRKKNYKKKSQTRGG